MSAGMASGIEGISARYAAQIQELLYVQTIRRMAAEQEAARAQARADEAHRLEDERARDAVEAVKVDVDRKAAAASASEDKPAIKPETKEPASAAVPPAQIFDVKA